jgi:hypothetical protein
MKALYPQSKSSMAAEAAWNTSRQMFGVRVEVPATGRFLTVSDILRTYRFSRYEYRTLYMGGKCVQASMEVVSPTDPTDRFIVTAKAGGAWECQTPRGRSDEGGIFISAVQWRIEQNCSEKVHAN